MKFFIFYFLKNKHLKRKQRKKIKKKGQMPTIVEEKSSWFHQHKIIGGEGRWGWPYITTFVQQKAIIYISLNVPLCNGKPEIAIAPLTSLYMWGESHDHIVNNEKR
jgi:hypothetical protein